MEVGRLRSLGLAREATLGTWITPTKFLRFIPPDSFYPKITPLIEKGIGSLPDVNLKQTPGPATLDGMKFKMEVEAENIGEILDALFGLDTPAEVASFVVTGHTTFTVTLNTNDWIDFTEDSDPIVHAQIDAGVYTVNELCAKIKAAMEAVNGSSTYTVTFSTTTKKFTITKSTGVFVINWATGTNTAISARSLLGYAATDTASAIVQVSTSAVTFAAANDAIPMTEDAGAEITIYLTPGTYKMGASSADSGSLCKLIKDQIESGNGTADTYTVTYSTSTRKLTITKNSGVFVFKWTTGVNANISAMALLGFSANSASAIAAISDSTTAVPPFSHTFVRQAVSQLPTYAFWLDKKPAYFDIGGCMLGKFDLEMKAKELVTADSEWHGLNFSDLGSNQSPSYSPVRPFTFNQATIEVDGAPVLGYDSLKLSINNMVKADHAISGSQYPAKIYSEGMDVELSADLFFEDVVQYNKFLAGTVASFVVTLTSGDDISGAPTGQKYKLVLNMPQVVYKMANLPTPSGVLKVTFTGHVMYDTATQKTINAVLTNGVPTTYSA